MSSTREREYKIEAAFLYNFFNYITWPGYVSPQALKNPLICVYGDDPIAEYLLYIGRKMPPERTLGVRVVREADRMQGCHLLFLRQRIPLNMLSKLPLETLTVLKPDDPLDRGGMIQLSKDEERIAIRIDQALLDNHGFQASSRLLEIARQDAGDNTAAGNQIFP